MYIMYSVLLLLQPNLSATLTIVCTVNLILLFYWLIRGEASLKVAAVIVLAFWLQCNYKWVILFLL